MSEHRENDTDTDGRDASLSRRDLIKRAAVVGGVAVWGVPLVRLAVGDGGDGPVRVATGGGPKKGPVAHAFPGSCEPTSLDPADTERLVCARNARQAEASFEASVRTECTARCAESTACAPGEGCEARKGRPATVADLGCTETGNTEGCPGDLYSPGTKQFRCTARVTCNCRCR